MALSYFFPLSPFPLIHSSFNFPFMIFLAPVSEMSPPQSDPEFYSVTYRAAGAQAGRRMGKNIAVIQWGWSSEKRNKTTFLPLSVAARSPERPPRLQLRCQLNAGLPRSSNSPTIRSTYGREDADALTSFSGEAELDVLHYSSRADVDI